LEKLIKNKKWIYLGLGLAVLVAALFPLFSLSIEFFGNSTSIEFSLRTLFQNIGGSSGDSAFNDLGQLFGQDNQSFGDLAREIILPFGAYLLTLLLVLVATVIAFFEKFKTATTVILVAAVGLITYSGFAFMNLPVEFDSAIADVLSSNPLLGLLGSLIDLSGIFSINLGVGYWLTLSFIIAYVVVKLILEFVLVKPVSVGTND